MIRRLAALILLSTLSQAVDLPQQLSMTVVGPGEDVSITCLAFAEHKVGLFYWFKLKFGYMVQTVASGSFQKVNLEREFQRSRFTINQTKTLYVLHIRNVSKEDEATYFCQAGTAYEMSVLNGTLLAVDDHNYQQKSLYVEQRPKTQYVTEGDTVSLQCSLLSTYKESREQCPGEHSVYWFRAKTGDSHPAVIYSQSHRRDGEDRRSCSYSLSKTIHNSSDAGTYYCAVMTCGEILFGEGTTLTTEFNPLYIVLGILLPYSVFVSAALIFYRNRSLVCKQCKGEISALNEAEHDRLAENQPSIEDGEETSLNYVALNFASRKAKRWKSTRESQQDCTYAGVGECL